MYTANNHLRVHCNERGFSPEDVEAICDISKSTKLASAVTTGEKGIGFKSLFRVASTVWIASGNYRFKLHSASSLKPEEFQLPFPDGCSADEGGTYMYLEIMQEKAPEVRAAIEQFDPTNILFLNNLERINITVEGIPPRQIYRAKASMDDGTNHVTIVENDQPLFYYKQFSFSVEPTVARSRRRGTGTSRIKLAFPVTEDFNGVQYRDDKDERVYACLPVASYGFKVCHESDISLI